MLHLSPMTITTTPPTTALSPDDFIEDLVTTMRSLKRPRPSKLMVGIYKGTAPVGAVRGYALEQYQYSKFVVNCIAAAISRMLERDNFIMLSENFSREAGFYQTANHIDVLAKFGAALGLSRERMESHTPMPETLGAMYTLGHFCNRSAPEAVGAFSLATEARGDILSEKQDGTVMPSFSTVFKQHYGMSDDDVDFYTMHELVEAEDAEMGFAMVRTYCDSAYNQHLIKQAVIHTSLTFDAMWYAWDRYLDDPIEV